MYILTNCDIFDRLDGKYYLKIYGENIPLYGKLLTYDYICFANKYEHKIFFKNDYMIDENNILIFTKKENLKEMFKVLKYRIDIVNYQNKFYNINKKYKHYAIERCKQNNMPFNKCGCIEPLSKKDMNLINTIIDEITIMKKMEK